MNNRIQLILKTKDISASKFADEIGVQRSSISHILSGRNNPSLDFIQKALKRFPDISPDWILTGKGSMYIEPDLFNSLEERKIDSIKQNDFISESHEDISSPVENLQSSEIEEIPEPKVEKKLKPSQKQEEIINNDIKTVSTEHNEKIASEIVKKSENRKIERVIIFYSDKSFIEYSPE